MSRLLLLSALSLLLPAAAFAQASRASASHVDTALRFAASEAARGAAAPTLAVTDAYPSERSGATHVYLRQTLAGLEVIGTEMAVTVGRTGDVVHAAGTDRPVATASFRGSVTPAIPAASAASALASHNGLGAGFFHPMSQKGGVDQAVTLSEGGIALEPVPARLVWHAGEDGALRLAWEVSLYQLDAQHYWLGYVDAETSVVLAQTDLVVHDTFGDAPAPAPTSLAPVRAAADLSVSASMAGSYTVFAMPVEAPYYGSRSAVSNPEDATASPFGWHDTNGAAGAEYTITRGNNVHAYTDLDANNSPDAGGSPDGGSGLTFNFPVDFSQAPSTYRPAAVTNLFYWNNIIHDVMHRYGFDEPAGNFQVNTYGRGGAGGDDVRAEAQDGSGTNNANFSTPADGGRPRMQMYIGTYPNPDVDGDFDNGVIVHEYGHGISNRLTGGPSAAGCLGNAEQQGEGWSDYYGLMFTMTSSNSRTKSRGIGNYLFGYGANGGGIRLAPYNTNFSVNGYTYGSTRNMTAVHQIGFVWATILWEVTWDMIDAHGFNANLYDAAGTAGNQMMMQLVTEGLKLQPCSPGFVSSRDAILAADVNLYGGAHTELLQAAFARRGLGYSANQGSTSRNTDNTEAFDLWPGGGGNQAPSAAFSASCTDLGCTFSDASADPDGSIASRSWTFGDGGTSTATNPSHTYASAGTYTVALTVTDNNGATDSASQTVTVTSGGGGGGNPIVLSASRGQRGPWVYADLSWTESDGGTMNVYRNNAFVGTTSDNGSTSYRIGKNASGTDTYRVCDAEDGECSNDVTLNYLDGFAGTGTAETGLDGAFPNPVTSTASIGFSLAEASDVEMVVYNSIGQQVATLASGLHESGDHQVTLDAAGLPSGVYVIQMRAGTEVFTTRLSVTR